jgi:hypothetical protein
MRRMVQGFAVVSFLVGCTSALSAASLSLTADNLSWDANSGPISPALLVRVANVQTVNDADRLAGWQLNLKLQPTPGATGTLRFNSANVPAANYLLEGNSAGMLSSIDAAGTTLTAFDDDDSLPIGVAVPATGKALLALDFNTPNLATGTFQLLALAPPAGFTQWGDATPADRFFTNVPNGSTAPIVLATITIVPEPSTLAIGGLGGLLLVSILRRRQRPA